MPSPYANKPEWLYSFDQRLSERLHARNVRHPCMFWFCPKGRPQLVVEGMNSKGLAAYDTWVQRANRNIRDAQTYQGGMRVGENGRLVFYGPGLDEDFLAKLAAYAVSNVDRVPALACLTGSTAADVQETDPRALRKVDIRTLERVGHSEAFQDLLRPSHARSGDELAGLGLGERAWFWLSPLSPTGAVKLIVQGVAADPSMDLFNQQIDKALAAGTPGVPPISGLACCVEGGRIQLVSDAWEPRALRWLADWVRATAQTTPSLLRLKGCQLVVADTDKVTQIIEDESLWAGIPDPILPGSLAEAAQILADFREGSEAWFWMADRGDGQSPLLSLIRTDDDPYAHGFEHQVSAFSLLYPTAQPVQGIVSQLKNGILLFSTEADSPRWPDMVRRLVAQQAALPGLERLQQARMVRLQNGEPGPVIGLG